MPPRRRASVVEADSDYSGSDYDAEDMMDGDAAGEGAAEGAGTKEPGDPSSTAKPLVVIKKGKKFKCPECTETFARVYELRRHQTVHRDERSFVCETCGAAFARKDALIRHVRSAQGNCERRASGGGRGRKPRREKLPSPPATASESPPPAPIEQPTLPPIQSIQNPFSVDIAEIPTGPIADLRPRSASFSSPTLPSPVLDPNVLFSPSFAATSIGTTAFQSNSSSDSVFHTVSGQYHVPLEPVATGTIPLPSMPISAASMTDVGLSVPMTVAPIIPPIPAQSFPFATVPPAVAKTAKPAQKPRSKRPMYGPFALVPLPKNMAPLFELYSQHGWIHHPIIHLPTLFHRLHLLSATPQSAADYAELELCPVTVQAVLWTTFRLAEHDEAVERWGAACWSNITMWAASLGIGPGSQPSDATPEEFVAFVQAGVIAGNVCLALGKYSDATWLRESSIRAHRAAKFGSSPKDSCIPDGSGGWTTRRDSRDLSAWIAAEERARAGSWLILWDSTASDVQGTRGTMVGGGYVLRDGEIRCVERSGYTGEEHLEPGHYHNVPLPCPDFLFEQLPPAPTNAKERDEWLRRDAASGGIIKWITIPYGEAINWVDLPYGSARRKKMLGVLIGGFLRSGYVRNCITNSGLQIRLVQYREYCRSRGFKLNDLPMGWAKDETRAREMRDSLVLQLRDIWENLPPEVREADEEGNGEKLKELATRWWGSKYDASIFMILATFHGVALTVHSPRDFIQDLAELAARTTARRQNNGLIMNFYDDDDEDLDLLEWTASPLFVIASSHAITVSKLVRSLLAPDGIRGRYVTGMASPKIVKSLSVLWPVIVLRAAWIHVLCIRKFQKIARQIQAGEEADPLFASLGMPAVSPDFLASLLDDIDACLKCIDEMAGGVPVDRAPAFDGIVKPAEKQQPPLKLGRDPWRYARLVHGVMRKLLRIDDGTGQRQSLSLTEEEIEELSLVKSSSV